MTAPVMVGPSPQGGGPVPSLEPREVELLERLARGETAQLIAQEWLYAESSVRTFAERLRKKLGAKTNEHAVFLACQLRILDPNRRHGDHAGFAAHRYYGEEPCEACWDGERAYRRDRRAARKTRTS
jgi:DNA-binding CsgD family transcriptional regulator